MQVNGKQLSSILRVTTARITQLKAEGVFQSVVGNRYVLEDCISKYIDFKIKSELGDSIEFDIEHARLEKAKREKAEIQLAELKGEMHPAADVEYVMNDMITAAKSKLRSIPVKVSPRLCSQPDSSIIKNILSQGIDDCLMELANYSPSIFKKTELCEDAEDG